MKLAAQFVARNGSEFLTGLRSREETKREFFFLKDNHSLHTTFKRMTDAYSAVLLDSKEALVQLREDAADSAAVLQRYACQPVMMLPTKAENCCSATTHIWARPDSAQALSTLHFSPF